MVASRGEPGICHAKYKTNSLQTQAGVEMKYRLAIQDLLKVVV